MPEYHIEHKTIYEYLAPVSVSHHSAHLYPISNELQSCTSFNMSISPNPTDINDTLDYFGNRIHFFSIQEMHQELTVDVRSRIWVKGQKPPSGDATMTCKEAAQFMNSLTPKSTNFAGQYAFESPAIPILDDLNSFVDEFIHNDKPILHSAVDICTAIYERFEFDPTATDVTTPVSEFFKKKRGVCQDFAHLALACLRLKGIPAAYVSGYILTIPPEGQERLIGADASHAWISIYVPEVGWVDIDPTNNCLCSDQHITIARGRDYTDVSLVRGAVTGGGPHRIDVSVTVRDLS